MCGDKDLLKTESGTYDFTRSWRHQEAHVVDQQLGKVIWEQVLELVEDSGDGLKKSN